VANNGVIKRYVFRFLFCFFVIIIVIYKTLTTMIDRSVFNKTGSGIAGFCQRRRQTLASREGAKKSFFGDMASVEPEMTKAWRVETPKASSSRRQRRQRSRRRRRRGGRVRFLKKKNLNAKNMASAGARAYMGVWGGAPSGVQGQSPWSGSGGEAPLKLKAFYCRREQICHSRLSET